MEDITEKNFEHEVLKSKIPVVIDFWAVWCGPCKVFSPIIEDTEKDYKGKVKFGKLNVDENVKIASEYGIMSIPTVLLFEKGEVKGQSVGAIPKDSLKKWINENL